MIYLAGFRYKHEIRERRHAHDNPNGSVRNKKMFYQRKEREHEMKGLHIFHHYLKYRHYICFYLSIWNAKAAEWNQERDDQFAAQRNMPHEKGAHPDGRLSVAECGWE